jgi:hypothetical protein
MNTKIEITATHPAFGEVAFTIPAEDAKQAFALWKQIVYSSRQWVVRKNTGSEFPAAKTVASPNLSGDDPDLNAADDI